MAFTEMLSSEYRLCLQSPQQHYSITYVN